MVTQRKKRVNADDTAFVYGSVVFASIDASPPTRTTQLQGMVTVDGKPGVAALNRDLQLRSEEWENPTPERFLDAMEAWIRTTGTGDSS